MTFYGHIQNGLLEMNDEESYHKFLTSLMGEVQVTVERRKKRRSNDENEYYWGVVVRILGNELGYMPDEMHDLLKWKFLRTGKKWESRGVIRNLETVKSTKSLSTVEFEDYLSKIRMWADSDLGIFLPLPNEPMLSKFI